MLHATLRAARMACLASICALLPLAAASAAKTAVIYNFSGGTDGAAPYSTLTPDHLGNAYGTTSMSGNVFCDAPVGCGTIFKLDNAGNLTTIHAFDGANGFSPQSGLTLIRGLLYGNAPVIASTGDTVSVFYTLGTDGSNYAILHDMTLPEGGELVGLLQPSPAGGEFGLGAGGGAYSRGTLFYLLPNNALAIAHSFAGGSDGQKPSYLIEDGNGTLFGSTTEGGDCQPAGTHIRNGCGTIFEYAPKTRTYTVLYRFQDTTDGYKPLLGAVGPDGTLYGVTTFGGALQHGALFALTPGAAGYTFSVLTPIMSLTSAINPPALSSDGALTGATQTGETYVYQNGQYKHYNNAAQPYAQGQYYSPANRPDLILGASESGGVSSTCPFLQTGCGFVFYERQ